LIIFFILLLTACDDDFSQPNMAYYVPDYIPIKNLLYTKAELITCAVNIFDIGESFKKQYSHYIENSNLPKSQNNSYLPWERTPIDGDYEKGGLVHITIMSAQYCFDDDKEIQTYFNQSVASKNNFFTYSEPGDMVLIYVQKDNRLIVLETN